MDSDDSVTLRFGDWSGEAVVENLVFVALDQILYFDAGGADEGFSRGERFAEGVAFVAVEDFHGGVEKGDVLALEVGNVAFVDDDFGGEGGALVFLGAGDGGGFFVAGLPFAEGFFVFECLLVALGDFLVEAGDGFFAGSLLGEDLLGKLGVLGAEGFGLPFEGGKFLFSGDFLGLGIGDLGLGGAELEHDGAELLAHLDGRIGGFFLGVEEAGEEREE